MPKILGVNIDSGSLNASLIDSTFRRVKHIKTEKIVLPESRGEERSSAILEALIKWQKELMPAGVVVGLPLHNFSWRTVEMPSMKKPDMQNALYFELEKYLPLPMDEYIFDFLIDGSGNTASNTVKALVFSIKKDVLNNLLKVVLEAGMEILSVRCSTTDILCGVMEISGEKRLEGIFLNVSDDAYEILGLHESVPMYMKKVPKTAEIRDEIAALAVQHPGKLYVAGPIDQSVISDFDSRKFQVLGPDLLASSYVRKTFLNLNFLPAELVKEKKDYYPYVLGGLTAATVLIFLLTGLLTWYKDWRAIAEIEAKVAAIKSKASGTIEAQKKLDLLQGDMGVLLGFQNKSNITIRVLNSLSATLPKDAWLMSLSIDDKGKVEMEGFTARTSNMVVALEKSNLFKNISFSAPIISKDREERFALKMEVEGF